MARPREFDEAIVLDAAVNCFWTRGSEATSVPDLAAEMGITGPSLYNAFGDKRALFRTALERYVQLWTRARIGLPASEALVRGDRRAPRGEARLCAGQGDQHAADGERGFEADSLRPNGGVDRPLMIFARQ